MSDEPEIGRTEPGWRRTVSAPVAIATVVLVVAVVTVGAVLVQRHRASADQLAAACSSYLTAAERVMGGARFSTVESRIVRARTELDRAGETDAADYLYGWGDPFGPSTASRRSAFWIDAFDYAREMGNPGMRRLDALCGRPSRPAALVTPAPETASTTTEVVPRSRPQPPQPDPTSRTETTTTTISFGEGVTGTGTFDDPLVGDGASVRFDTFEAWFSVRRYPAGSGQELPTTTDHACVVVDYQAADGAEEVTADELLGRIGLTTVDGVELQRVDGFVQWPDDWMARLEGSDPVAWGNIVSRALCHVLPPEQAALDLLVRVDDRFVLPWSDPTSALPTTSTDDADDDATDDADTEVQLDGTASCDGYSYDDELPVNMCSSGLTVELAQQQLGLDADGLFGPGTRAAVQEFQASVGLVADGVIDVETWRQLGAGDGLPYDDLNGDGVVDGSEIPVD